MDLVIRAALTICFGVVISLAGLGRVHAGANATDRTTHWKRNFRCPDVLVFLNGITAQNKRTHWLCGPDFAVEIGSRHDRSREKFDFDARVGTRELQIVDRYPWALELYRLGAAGTLDLVGRSTIEQPDTLASAVLPLAFRLQPGTTSERPTIVVQQPGSDQTWIL